VRAFFLSFRIILLVFLFSCVLSANESIKVQVKEIAISDFIHLVSKTTNKNIVIIDKPEGNIEFALSSNVKEDELIDILQATLETKGFILVENGSFYKVVNQKSNIKNTKVILLKYIEASTIHTMMVNSYNKELISFDIDQDSNSIILYGTDAQINSFEKILQAMDKPKIQIYVETKIIEISQNKLRDVGFKYGLSSAMVSGNSLYTLSAELGSRGVSGVMPYGFNLKFPSDLVTNSLNLWTTLALLQKNDALEIISEPSILAINNQESSIYVGKRRSIQISTTLDKNGNPIANIERLDIGLRLKVKPRVTNEQKVMLDIYVHQEESNSAENSLQPISDKKEIQTTAIVNSGENVILGGYIKNKTYNSVDKVPFLGDMPILGNLFKYNSDSSDKISLVIILTPYIVENDKDLIDLQQELSKLKMLEAKYSKELLDNLQVIEKEKFSSNDSTYERIVDGIVDKKR